MFSATPNSIIEGGSSALSWNVTSASDVFISVIGASYTSSNGDPIVGGVTVSPIVTTSYKLTAWPIDPFCVARTRTINVTVTPPAPTCTVTTTPNTISLGDSTTVGWTSTDATSCTWNVGPWDTQAAAPAAAGTQNHTPVAQGILTYGLGCTGPGGSVSCAGTVDVGPPPCMIPPAITSFTATPDAIIAGAQSTLAWTVTNAANVSINQGVGGVANPTGTFIVTPPVTTTYTIDASPADVNCAHATGTVTIDVEPQIAPDNAVAIVDGNELVFGSMSPDANMGTSPGLAGLPSTTHRIFTAQADRNGNADLRWSYLYINLTDIATPDDAPPLAVLGAYDYVNRVFFIGDLACIQASGPACWTAVPGNLFAALGDVKMYGTGAYGEAGSVLRTATDTPSYLPTLAGRMGAAYDGSMAAEVTWFIDLSGEHEESPAKVYMAALDSSG